MALSWRLAFLSFTICQVLLAKASEEAVVGPDGTVAMAECVDLNERCSNMVLRNPYCTGIAEAKELDEDYMYQYCPKSCKACGLSGKDLEEFKKKQRLLESVGGDERLLETPYGYKQKLASGKRKEIKDVIAKMEEYMTNVVMVEPKYERVRKTCKLRHDSCAYWKAMGQCEEKQQKRYMRQNCAPVCEVCEELDFFHWCPVDESVPYAVQKGELNPMFEKILTDPEFQKYEPRALRKPDDDQPYILVLDSFLSEEEADMLIQLGQDIGYTQSVDTGPAKNDGSHGNLVTTWRTSHTAWCGTKSCLTHDVPIAIANRVQNLTGIPIENAEHLQILKYETDQFYNYHHDCTPHHKERQMGPRVLTFFFYLNTVEEGGGTQFPNADNLIIQPKKGRAVLWPNTLDKDPSKMDTRTAHQANPVEAGTKYAANYWIHQRDWREAAKRGCIS
mmetsp:Transcript_10482/g.15422  ORF Transcript_10482/g.15422 Transcript_10482/m.15422 type:complete len:447 (-) Transcript_10482:385-1725(-)